MPDVISASERALIDAALPSKRTVIPLGETSGPIYRWNGSSLAVDPACGEYVRGVWVRAGETRKTARHRATPVEVVARRARVREMLMNGRSQAEIAGVLGVPAHRVLADVEKMRRTGVLPPSKRRSPA